MDIKTTHSNYIQTIEEDLKKAGMSDEDIQTTIETLLITLEDDVITDLFGRLDEDTYAQVIGMLDDNASVEDIATAAHIGPEAINEAIESRLEEYVSNLGANSEELSEKLSAMD